MAGSPGAQTTQADHRRGWIAGQAEHNTAPTLSGDDGFAGLHLDLVRTSTRRCALEAQRRHEVMIADADTARQQHEISLLGDAIKRPVDVGAMIP